MTFLNYQEKSKPLFQSLKILTIYELNMYLIALFMHSYFSNNLPKYFNNYFILNKNIHSHDTQSASNIFIDYKRKNYGKFSLKHRGAQIWNNLPIEFCKAIILLKEAQIFICKIIVSQVFRFQLCLMKTCIRIKFVY